MRSEQNSVENRTRSYRWGIVAEYICALWLILKGYSVLMLRHRNKMGEIDLIALRGRQVVFVEVKARKQRRAALESITPEKQERLLRSANMFIAARKKYAAYSLRFDVMVITSPWNIYHLKDAWRLS